MSKRVWLGTILLIALALAGLEFVGTWSMQGPSLRSEHSDPAIPLSPAQAAQEVVVNPAGKTFHKPGCTFIHGKGRLMDARQAVREGYVPCVRCEKALIPK